MDETTDSRARAGDMVEGALRALAEGRLDAFRAVDDEMGLAVSVVEKDLDRYNVRREPLVPVPDDAEGSRRDEWRSHAWVAAMLRQGHWRPVPQA